MKLLCIDYVYSVFGSLLCSAIHDGDYLLTTSGRSQFEIEFEQLVTDLLCQRCMLCIGALPTTQHWGRISDKCHTRELVCPVLLYKIQIRLSCNYTQASPSPPLQLMSQFHRLVSKPRAAVH